MTTTITIVVNNLDEQGAKSLLNLVLRKAEQEGIKKDAVKTNIEVEE